MIDNFYTKQYIIEQIKKSNELKKDGKYGGYPAKAGYLEQLLKNIYNISDDEVKE